MHTKDGETEGKKSSGNCCHQYYRIKHKKTKKNIPLRHTQTHKKAARKKMNIEEEKRDEEAVAIEKARKKKQVEFQMTYPLPHCMCVCVCSVYTK